MSKENIWKKVGENSVSIEEKDEVEEIKERWSSGFNALLKEGYIFLTGQAIKDIDFLLSSLEKEKERVLQLREAWRIQDELWKEEKEQTEYFRLEVNRLTDELAKK